MTAIQLNNLEELVTFPSFHTACGVLFAWALWRVRYLWIVGLILNVLMIASTPISGSHYLIDVIAGAGVAYIAIVIAGRVAGGQRNLVRPLSGGVAHTGAQARSRIKSRTCDKI